MPASRFWSPDGSSLAPLEYERATLIGPDGKVLRHDHGLEYVFTGNGRVALRDAPFEARHPLLARLVSGVGSFGMCCALNPGLVFSGQQYHPEADTTVTAVGAAPADAISQYKVRRHLARAAPAPQLAYVVPIDDGTELGIANLDTADAQVAVYSNAPTIFSGDSWRQILVSPGLVLDTAVPVRLTVPAGGFAWVTPQPGLFAALSVTGANSDLVQIIAQHTHTMNGHVLTETVPASRLDEMVPADGTGFVPGPENPAYYSNPGVMQGVLLVSGKDSTTLDLIMESCVGGQQLQPLHYTLDPWSGLYIPDVWRALNGTPPPGAGLYYLKVQPTAGALAVYGVLTDTASGKHSTLLAAQDKGETDFLFPVQRIDATKLTEPHAIHPAVGLVLFLPQLQPRDTITPPIPSIKSAKQLLSNYWHWAWPDGVTSLFLPNTSYDVSGFVTGHGALYDKTWLTDFVDGPHVPLLVWNHLQIIMPYGDVGQWARALYPSDACGGAQQVPCSAIGITPLTRILLANAAAASLPVSMDFYDATGSRISTEQKTLRPNENTALEGIVPPGAVRVMNSTPAGNTGTYYFITQTRTAGDCDDYQVGKPLSSP